MHESSADTRSITEIYKLQIAQMSQFRADEQRNREVFKMRLDDERSEHFDEEWMRMQREKRDREKQRHEYLARAELEEHREDPILQLMILDFGNKSSS